MTSSRTQIRILLLLLLSGFCALTYEILWAKQLALTLGSSIDAISIVTATFMTGLAIGSYTVGRRADRLTSPLKLYALLEAGICFFALTFPYMLDFSEQAYVWLHQALPDWPGAVAILRLLIAALLILPPTVLMGGTLPVIARFHAPQHFSATVGRMYAVNTLGGVAGCFLGGFFLIPELGLVGTNHLALACNLLLVGTALYLAERHSAPPPVENPPHSELSSAAPPVRLSVPFIAMAGALSLALEILWTRLLILMLGNTTYAFSSILAVFLLGLAIGGWCYALLLQRGIAPRLLFFCALMFASLFIMVTHNFYDQLAHLFLYAHELADGRWWLLSQLNLAIITAVLLPPTVAFGAILPAGIALLAPHSSGCSQATGLALFSNTLGTVIGSLAAGFFLLPRFGLHLSFEICLVIALLTSFCFLFCMRPVARRARVLVAAGLLVCLALVPATWDPTLINSGVYVYAQFYKHQGGLDATRDSYQILDVVEGKETTVAVFEDLAGIKTFRVNGKTDGSTGPDMLNQVLAAQLPLLMHPDPESALVVGLGTGITLGEVLSHPVRQVDCIEISPEVVEIAKHFTPENRTALTDARARIHVKDGRNFLLTTLRSYDVIISEPSNPWQSGNASLFTYEFYGLVKQRLNPGGIFCQWIPLYDLNTDKLAVAFKTFAEQFDDIRVFRIGAEVIMLGSDTPITFDHELVAARMAHGEVAGSLDRFGILTPSDLVKRYYYCNRTALLAFGQDARLNRDRRPVLEYAQVLGADLSRQNIQALEATRQLLGARAVD